MMNRTECLRTAFDLAARAVVFDKRGQKNWTRDNPGDEKVARDYWERASLLRFRARGYVTDYEYNRISDAVHAGKKIEDVFSVLGIKRQ